MRILFGEASAESRLDSQIYSDILEEAIDLLGLDTTSWDFDEAFALSYVNSRGVEMPVTSDDDALFIHLKHA